MFEPVIKPKGLYTSPNPFSVSPSGALLKADNLVQDEDGTIRSRRGQELISVSATVGASTGFRPEKCWWYNNRIWVHFRRPTNDAGGFADRVLFWDWSGVWRDGGILNGTVANPITIDATGKIKIRQCEANRRQLICTNTGIYRTASGTTLAGTVASSAGTPRGIDIRFTALTVVAGGVNPMAGTSVAGYRAVWKSSMDSNQLQAVGAPSGKCTAKNTTANASTPTIRVGIPSGNGTTSILQIYRTQFFQRGVDGTYPDVGEDFYLCTEITPTATDVANFYVSYSDIVPDSLLGQPLYTNANQAGDLQGRAIPPASRDVAYFEDTAFYLNTISKHRFIFSILAVNDTLVAANNGITVGDHVTVGGLTMVAVDGGATGLPVAAESLSGPTYWAFACDRTTGSGSEVVRVLKTTESFCYKYNLWSNVSGGKYYAYNITGADDIVGKILIEERQINGSIAAYFNADRLDSPPNYVPTPVLDTSSTTGLSKSLASVNNNGTTVTLTWNAAHGLSSNNVIYFYWFGTYTSLTNSKAPDNAYTITVTGATTATFPTPIGSAIGVDAAAIIGYAHLVVDAAKSNNDTRINRVMYSALQEPENAPISNRIDVGRADAEGLKMQKLGQSLFIFKEDGLFRLTGTGGSWQIDEFDPSVRLLAPESVAVVNNAIYCLTDQGVVRITEGGASVISREIENEIFAAVLANTSVTRKESFGIGYEDDRKYILWMPTLSTDTKPTQAFVFNMFTKSWTKRTDQGNTGIVGRRDDVLTDIQHLYLIKDKETWLTQERKTNSVKDYADESSNQTSNFSIRSGSVMRFTSPDPYFLVVDNLMTINGDDTKRGYIKSLNAGLVDVTLEMLSNETKGIAATDPATWGAITSVTVYKSIPHSLTFNHFVGAHQASAVGAASGGPDERKSYSEVYVTWDQPYMSKYVLSFITDLVTTAQSVNAWAYAYNYWTSSFPWSLRTYTGQLLGRTLRALIPTASSKCSQMLVNVTHSRAWENFSLRGINLRSTDGSKNVQRTNS